MLVFAIFASSFWRLSSVMPRRSWEKLGSISPCFKGSILASWESPCLLLLLLLRLLVAAAAAKVLRHEVPEDILRHVLDAGAPSPQGSTTRGANLCRQGG